MNSYELWINKPIGGWVQLVLGEEEPALNLQSNKVANLQQKSANYTQSINLPFCKENDLAFEGIRFGDSSTDLPYTNIPCALFYGGVQLAGPSDGAMLLINGFNKAYNCQVLSGSAQFYTIMKSLKFADYDFGIVPLTRAAVEAVGNNVYTYGIAQFIADSTINNVEHMELDKCKPFVYVSHVMRRMFEICGYTLDTAPSPETLTSLATLKHDNIIDPTKYSGDAYSLIDMVLADNDPRGRMFIGTSDASGHIVLRGERTGTGYYAARYWAPVTGKVKINVKVSEPMSYPAPNYYVTVIRSVVDGVIDTELITGYGKEFNIERSIKGSVDPDARPGNYVEVYANTTYIDNTNYNFGTSATYTFTFEPDNDPDTPIGGDVNIAINLGFETFFDYFKMYIQFNGFFVHVDETTKTVYTYPINSLNDNIIAGKALDWSDKVDRGNRGNVTLHPVEYAQNSYVKFAENGYSKYIDKWPILINDKTLAVEKDVLDLAPLESGEDLPQSFSNAATVENASSLYTAARTATIPMFNRKKADISTEPDIIEKIDTKKPHLVLINGLWPARYKSTFYNTVFNSAQYPLMRHRRAEYVVNAYSYLRDNVLRSYMEIEEELHLTAEDIDKINVFIPIYIERYGAYFYVDKVQNFVANKLTKVTLIRL